MDVTYLSDILKKVSEKSMDVDTALEVFETFAV